VGINTNPPAAIMPPVIKVKIMKMGIAVSSLKNVRLTKQRHAITF
jgi:hypothetical protein